MASAGEQFRRLRVEHHLGLDELSQLTQIAVERLQAIEAGAEGAWLEEAMHLARAYQMTVDDLAAYVHGWSRR